MKKVAGGVTTTFHYSQNGQIIAESNSAGTSTAEYVYLNGQQLAKMEGVNTYYYHNDHLGTPQKLTDSTGQVVWAADYKPFGEVNITTNAITNNLRFSGQYYDAETGNHYNYYRDYNPIIGLYIEADPVGLKGGRNHLFTYADQNPIIFTDPEGLAPGGGSGATIQPQGFCNGNWKQVSFDRVFNFICKCYWICNSCDGPSLWSGNNQSLLFTYGNITNSSDGRGAGVKRGDACLCDKPGPDTGCNKCKK